MAKTTYKRRTPEEIKAQVDAYGEQIVRAAREYTATPEDLHSLLDFMAQFPTYSVRNQVLIKSQSPGAQGVASFRRFQDLGASVQKGEHALKIFAPQTSKTIRGEDGKWIPYSKATVEQKAKAKSGALQHRERVVGYRMVNVFDVTQTDLSPDEYPKLYPNRPINFVADEQRSQILYDALVDYSKSRGVSVSLHDGHLDQGSLGVTRTYSDNRVEILIDDHLPKTQQVTTLVHEVGHSLMHTGKQAPKLDRPFEELQAEMVSNIVSKYYGIDTKEDSAGYIASWTDHLKKLDDKDFVTEFNILNRANQTSRQLIAALDPKVTEALQLEEQKSQTVDKHSEQVPSISAKPFTPERQEQTKAVADFWRDKISKREPFAVVGKNEDGKMFRMQIFSPSAKHQGEFQWTIFNSEGQPLSHKRVTEAMIQDPYLDIDFATDLPSSSDKSKFEITRPEIQEVAPPEKLAQKRSFKKAEVAKAAEVDIVDFAEAKGIPLNKVSSRQYRGVEHDSLVIDQRKNYFMWNSRNVGGNVIKFAETFAVDQSLDESEKFKQSVGMLLNDGYELNKNVQIKEEPFVYKEDKYRPLGEGKALKYLTETRQIDPQIIQEFSRQNLLVTDSKGAAIFKWVDPQSGKCIGAFEQGTTIDFEKYKKRGTEKHIEANSQADYGFMVTKGSPKNLHYFESEIDLASYLSLNGLADDTRYISMNGLKKATVTRQAVVAAQQLGQNPDSIVLNVDNDEAGLNFVKDMQSRFSLQHVDGTTSELVDGTPSKDAGGKDWNDVLIATHDSDQQLQVRHERARRIRAEGLTR